MTADILEHISDYPNTGQNTYDAVESISRHHRLLVRWLTR